MNKIDLIYRRIKELLDDLNLERLLSEFEKQIMEYYGQETEESDSESSEE
jgi:hypothetical protein